MKRIIISILIFVGFACTDEFLDKAPLTEKVEQNFYETPEDAFEGLVAVYDILQRTGYGHFVLTTEMASDNCFGGGGKNDGFSMQRWDAFIGQWGDEFDLNRPVWRDNYIGVFRANKLISKLDEVNWGSEEALKMQYEAEARFLRAYFYFELVRLFENIPLITEPLKVDEIDVPQEDPANTYAQIARDLKFGIENLSDTPYGQMANMDYGRVTKWAAETLMGRVFLFYTDYYETNSIGDVVSKQDVIGYIDDVINNSGHDLVEDYNRLWRASAASADVEYAGENNTETIWAVKYTHKGLGDWGLNEGNRWMVMIGLRGQRIPPYGTGWGFATVNPNYWNAFDTDDTRRNATIISFDEEGLDFDPTDQRQYTGYTWKKYQAVSEDGSQNESEELGGDFQIDNFEDYMALRFSDALLMGAELNLDTDESKAQEYFDRVRERAFGDEDHNLPVSYENILAERRFEFGLEGHRYHDLIRQDMETAKSAIDYVDQDENDDDDFNINFPKSTGGFLKIPESQIDLSNGGLEQNKGWK